MKLTIDTEQLTLLVQDGEQIIMRPDAEDAIATLLEVEEQIKQIKDQLKARILLAGERYSPHFTGVTSDRLRITYGVQGGQAKYYIEADKINEVDKSMYTQKISYSIDTKAVDKFVKEHGALPQGINPTTRSKSLSIGLRKRK